MLLHKLSLTLYLQTVVFRGHALSVRKNEWTLTSNNNSDLAWNFASDVSCCAPVHALVSRRNARNDELIVTNPSVVRQLSTNSLPIHRRPRATNCSDTKQLSFTRNQFPQQTLPKESHLQSPQSSEARYLTKKVSTVFYSFHLACRFVYCLIYDTHLYGTQVWHVLMMNHTVLSANHTFSARVKWATPAFTSQPQIINAFWPVPISHPTESRRLSWPGWLIIYWDGMPANSPHLSSNQPLPPH